MDKALYVAMTGANQLLRAQQINANNLANVDTAGFKADLALYSNLSAQGAVFQTRVNTQLDETRVNFAQGSLMQTNEELDLAIQGEGFFAVQAPDGNEAYSRSGNFHLDANGFLNTPNGFPVLGSAGPVVIPPAQKIDIAGDGTVSYLPQGATDGAMISLGRIKLVKPESMQDMRKLGNGLYANVSGGVLDESSQVHVSQGFLESSNVNAIDAITNMISLARQYEFQIRMMDTVEKNDQASDRIMNLSQN
jgi:flagellar basal-body rod protein FlgF